MKKFLLVLGLVALSLAASKPLCQICIQVPNCAPEVLNDESVDPLYNALISKVSVSSPPKSITKVENEQQANYTFEWEDQSYLAVVDLTTRGYKVMQIGGHKSVTTTTKTTTTTHTTHSTHHASHSVSSSSQSSASGQSSSGQSSTSVEQSSAGGTGDEGEMQKIFKVVDQNIKKRFFSGQEVKCVSFQRMADGYLAAYQQGNAHEIVKFQVTVKREGNNIMLGYHLLNHNGVSKTTTTTTTQTTSSQSSGSSSAKEPETVPRPPVTGGWQKIESPLENKEVQHVIGFLVSQLGQIVKSAYFLSVEVQVVSGKNFRLALSFDQSSEVYYAITVYWNIEGELKVVEIQAVNVKESYEFGDAISAADASQLSYIQLLHSLVTQRVDEVTDECQLVKLYKDFPYFKLVYQSQQYQRIIVTVAYDVLNNNLSVLKKRLIERKAQKTEQPQPQQPEPKQPEPVPEEPETQPEHPEPVPEEPETVPRPPVTGGWQKIESPLENKEVQHVIGFLVSQLGQIVKSAYFLSVEVQVVSGKNFRLALSFDQSSEVYYAITVYWNIEGELKVVEIQAVNVKESYEFGDAISAADASQLSYIQLLHSLVTQRVDEVTDECQLVKLYKDFPYFKLVYQSQQYERIIVIISYSILQNSIIILDKRLIEREIEKPERPPQVGVPAPISAPTEVQVKEPHPEPQPKVEPKESKIEKVSQQFLSSVEVQTYITYLSSKSALYQKSSLIAVYWLVSDHSAIFFHYQLSDGQVEQHQTTLKRIKFIYRRWKRSQVDDDDHCIRRRNGKCLKCAFKYYLSDNKCHQVQTECRRFDYKANVCKSCYHGYYLDLNNVCQQANYLCKTTNRKGMCLTCFNNYHLTVRGTCSFNAKGLDENYPHQLDNPLCKAFEGNKCLGCVNNSFLAKIGVCKIPDPNCHKFDYERECCSVCRVGYRFEESKKLCVPTGRHY